ncbi:FAD-dependent oxidoreductase [Nocardioides sp. NPDC092400]|uniref:FAD-dependent oxidoreductase n=1 Tax=Nocardioides sp. NPDC092400 TaxID=3155196 RepID=UPI0034488BBE
MDQVTHDVVVVGAGPAGMSAAVAAADAGLRVAVVDEQRRAGGQIFRQPPEEFAGVGVRPGAGYGWALPLLRDFESHPLVDHRPSSSALGVLREVDAPHERGAVLTVAVSTPAGGVNLRAPRLVLATGAYDLPVAFPGWTLPGVMTAGGVQSLLKSQHVRVAGPVVVAGSHPLLIVVAEQLRAAGADVVEVAFARGLPTPGEGVRARRAVPGHAAVLAETARAVANLVAHGVRISTRTAVVAAHGRDGVESVELARIDSSWRQTGRRRTRAAATLVVGYGFTPSTELARQAGCEVEWSSPRGGWVVRHDESFAASLPGVWVAGEPTGVGGAEQARAEGRLAGLALARDADPHAVSADDLRAAEDDVRRAGRFAGVVQDLFEPDRAGMTSWADHDTTICRCELVTRGTVEQVLADNPFLSTASAVKLECRAGMGPCQGRYCEGAVGALVSQARDQAPADSGHFSGRFPVKPTPLGVLADLVPEDTDIHPSVSTDTAGAG